MAILANGSSKKCVTCQHFGGNRVTDMSKRNVRYEATVKGACAKTKTTKTGNQAACPKWEKWGTLK